MKVKGRERGEEKMIEMEISEDVKKGKMEGRKI